MTVSDRKLDILYIFSDPKSKNGAIGQEKGQIMKHHKEYICEHRANYTYLLGIMKLGLSEEDNPKIKVRENIFELAADNLESRSRSTRRDNSATRCRAESVESVDPVTQKDQPKKMAPSFGNPKTTTRLKNGT